MCACASAEWPLASLIAATTTNSNNARDGLLFPPGPEFFPQFFPCRDNTAESGFLVIFFKKNSFPGTLLFAEQRMLAGRGEVLSRKVSPASRDD